MSEELPPPDQIRSGAVESERRPDDWTRDDPVPGFGRNLLNQRGLLYRPILDQRRLERDRERPTWPDGCEFAVCLSHDVDAISSTSVRQPLRQALLRARCRLQATRREGPSVAKEGLHQVALALGGGVLRATRNAMHPGADPLQQFERWLELEDSLDTRSTLFVPPESSLERHVSDPVLQYDDPVRFEGERLPFSDVLRTIDERGWEIGLHPTWYAFDDPVELRRQKSELEDVLGHEIRSVRQHWLHYDVEATPRAHAEAGFRYDSTIGVTGNVGFQRGTAYPWRLRDLEHDERLELLEVPLVAQDTGLFDGKYLDLDEDLAVAYLETLADRVADVGGVLTLNWHPDLTLSEERWNAWERALERLDDRNAWFGTVAEIGEYWSEQHGDFYD